MLIPHYCYRTHAELHQSPYFIMHFKFFISYVKCVYELQDIGGDLHDSTLQVCIASKANSSLCTSSGGVLLYLAIKFLNISIYTSYGIFLVCVIGCPKKPISEPPWGPSARLTWTGENMVSTP